MQLITGRTGTQHVKATDDAEIYRTLLGDGDFVLSTAQKLNAQMNGTNEIDIYAGTAIMQGRQVKIRPSEGYNAVTLDNGVAGYKRWDVVCIEYNKEDDIESAELVVIKGANSTNYVEPTVAGTSGSIDNGEMHRMKLWGVKFNGINFDSLVDYRTILDTSPVNVLLDSLTAIEEQIEARISAVEQMARTVPMFTAEAVDVATDVIPIGTLDHYSAFTLEYPTGYSYDETDSYELYLNGLVVRPSQFEVIDYNGSLLIDISPLTGTTSSVGYDEVLLKIWKMEE